jgi:Ca2+-binding EF-hand superfamily protein
MKITLALLLLAAALPALAAETPAAAPAEKDIHVKDTPKERKRVHAHFAALDKNKDGVIDDAELAAYAKALHASAVKAAKKKKDAKVASEADLLADLKKELSKADAKHDGKVTEAEYDQYEEPLEK